MDASSALLRGVNFVNLTGFTLEEVKSRSWASGTFIGTRHALTFRLEGEGASAEADAFLSELEEREFDLRGHILADIGLVARTETCGEHGPLVRIALEALTVEDR